MSICSRVKPLPLMAELVKAGGGRTLSLMTPRDARLDLVLTEHEVIDLRAP